ncbi:hypothetical protein [Nitrososphaera viennensis]|uniref:Uncharacterized protein n=2 Tax=Nitrososphaera viennensis TaxID=1034015 RepID=A0A060HU78_9ARCH|nr:hypothetical protein [Nitrososphaera viennensis]AIC16667.1 hypothetical protein NVIE_024040 [Nitrososphaera viennensis EN76]UVS68589.1 hypothetical protein NWT39_11855 [Nitrososphaera viennensis]
MRPVNNTITRRKDAKEIGLYVTENYHILLKEPSTANALIEKPKLNVNVKATFKGRIASYQTILYGNVQVLAKYLLNRASSDAVF